MNVRPIVLHAAIAAAIACLASSSAFARKLPNFDAGAQSAAQRSVPAFVWAKELGALPKVTAADPEGAARAYLKSAAAKYGMSAGEVDGLVAGDVQRFADGGSIARFSNRVDGIEVFRDQVNVLVDKSGALVAISGAANSATSAKRTFDTGRLTSVDAIGTALAEHGFAPDVAKRVRDMKADGGYTWSTLDSSGTDGATLAAPLRTKRVWFRQGSALVPAW
jgi:large repetitive protein